MWLELGRILVAPLLAGIVAALATNYFAARFSFSRFRREQWWTEKREAYHSIVRKLSEIAFNARAEIARLETGGEMSPDKAPQRDKALSWSLQEIASAGAYIVTDKTVKAVEKALDKIAGSFVSSGGNEYEMWVKDYDAAVEALTTVRAEAHRDLGV